MRPSADRIEEIALQIFARLRHDTAQPHLTTFAMSALGTQPALPEVGLESEMRRDADIDVKQSVRGLLQRRQ
jgi:hypothetical protein